MSTTHIWAVEFQENNTWHFYEAYPALVEARAAKEELEAKDYKVRILKYTQENKP